MPGPTFLRWLVDAPARLRDALRGDIGGPVDRRYPRQERPLGVLHVPGGPTVSAIGVTSGEHYAGAPLGLSTRSESGLVIEGARACDIFQAEVLIRVQDHLLYCLESPRPAGLSLYYRTRLPTREAAESALDALWFEGALAALAAGPRLALRIRYELVDPRDWHVLEFGPALRWGVAWSGHTDPDEVAREVAPFTWHRAERATSEAPPRDDTR